VPHEINGRAMDNFSGDCDYINISNRYIISLPDLRKIFESTKRLLVAKKFKSEFLSLRQANCENQLVRDKMKLMEMSHDLYQKYKELLPEFLPDPHSFNMLLQHTFKYQEERLYEFLQLYYDYLMIQIEINVFLMDAKIQEGKEMFMRESKRKRIENVKTE